MRMFADREDRRLLVGVAELMLGFGAILVGLHALCAPVWTLGGAYALLCACVLAACAAHLARRCRRMEQAIQRMQDYLDGAAHVRLDCDDEGALCRLFHAVNTMAAVLNAHAENGRRDRMFLKDTISDISHQLKTPLAALNIYNGLLLSEAQDLPQIREFAARSEQELDRIETLVQNLLKITRMDAGALVMEKAEQNIAEMMRDIELHFACRARSEGKRLALSGEDPLALVCDRDWLMEAIGNLVQNALDHTEAGDEICIEWKRLVSAVQLIVRDTGCGIHPEDIHHIFKRFYRSRFSKDTQGIGLGLPLAKAIIEANGGAIEVCSAPGQGAAFSVIFAIPTELSFCGHAPVGRL